MRALNSRHREVRRLKKIHSPALFGNRVWGASWLMVDYLSNRGLPKRLRVMDIGCGWGLAGIYCASRFESRVVSVDHDWDVYPFLNLHNQVNNTETNFMNEDFQMLDVDHFSGFDVVIGVDICFWEKLVAPLNAMIDRAFEAGVRLIILADPGRPTFNRVGDHCEQTHGGRQRYWSAEQPYHLQGQIIEAGPGMR